MRTRFFLPLCFVAWALGTAFAGDASGQAINVSVAGAPKGNGTLELTLYAKAPNTSYLKIFSEPSHTPLLLVLNKGQRSLGQEQRQTWTQAGGAVIETALEEAAPRMGNLRRPGTDTRIVVLAGTPSGERVLADAQIGTGPFSFSVDWQDGKATHCCDNAPCGHRCAECSDPAFTCCGANCEVSCGHVGCR
ncbi:MAG: hypothetical protein ACOY7U_01975 [Acidobacteriota bacterium]|nr:hypothetical protein HRbin09_00666 [bacterium HR09]